MYAFIENRDNPHVLYGAIVGGPASNDSFSDKRRQFEFTEVALDYNVGLTLGLAGVSAFPPTFWTGEEVDCSLQIANYPWSKAAKNRKKATKSGNWVVQPPRWSQLQNAGAKTCETANCD